MTIPLVMLAFGAAAVGLLGSPVTHGWLFKFLEAHEVHEGLDLGMLALSTGIVGFGVWLAWQVGFRRRRFLPAGLHPLGARLSFYASNTYFVDELYDRAIVQPFLRMTERFSRFDRRVIDGAVDGAGAMGWWIGQLKDWCDRHVVDRLVNGVAQAMRLASSLGRRFQTGVVHHYLFAIVASVVLLAAWLL